MDCDLIQSATTPIQREAAETERPKFEGPNSVDSPTPKGMALILTFDKAKSIPE